VPYPEPVQFALFARPASSLVAPHCCSSAAARRRRPDRPAAADAV